MIRVVVLISLAVLVAHVQVTRGRPKLLAGTRSRGSLSNDAGGYDTANDPPPPSYPEHGGAPPNGDYSGGGTAYPDSGGGKEYSSGGESVDGGAYSGNGGGSGGYSGGGAESGGYSGGGGGDNYSGHSGGDSGYNNHGFPPVYPSGGYSGSSSSSFSVASSSAGGNGNYAHSASYGGGVNPFQYLFGYWRPPYIHKGGGIHITNCIGCINYADAVDGATENLTPQKACLGFIEKLVEAPEKPTDLAKEVEKLQKKSPSDPSSLILQCCHSEYKNKLFSADVAAHISYPLPEGLESGKTCKDVVKSFFKLMTNDYPHLPAGGGNVSTTAAPKKLK